MHYFSTHFSRQCVFNVIVPWENLIKFEFMLDGSTSSSLDKQAIVRAKKQDKTWNRNALNYSQYLYGVSKLDDQKFLHDGPCFNCLHQVWITQVIIALCVNPTSFPLCHMVVGMLRFNFRGFTVERHDGRASHYLLVKAIGRTRIQFTLIWV